VWRVLGALVFLFAFAVAEPACAQNSCDGCWANGIHQQYTSTITDVALAADTGNSVVVGNEGVMSGIIVVPGATAMSIETTPSEVFVNAPFGRIDQIISQTLSNIGSEESGARGITMNKALQASWIQNQGTQENDPESTSPGSPVWKKESACTLQETSQSIAAITDYGLQNNAKIFNADKKLAMIVDDINAAIDITKLASSSS